MDPITAIYLGYGLLRDAVKGADNVLRTVETAVGMPGRVKQLYSHVSATSFGDAAERRLRQSRPDDLLQVGPNAFVNNNLVEVSNLRQHHVLNDRPSLQRLFQPLTQISGNRMFSSQVTSIPLASATENPWKVLHDPRPLVMASGPPSADHVPVIFEHEGLPFVGWQLRGVLPQLFGIQAQQPAHITAPSHRPDIAQRLRKRLFDVKLSQKLEDPMPHGCWLAFALSTDPMYIMWGYRFDFQDERVEIRYAGIGLSGYGDTRECFTLQDFQGLSIKSHFWGGISLLFPSGKSLKLRSLTNSQTDIRFLKMVKEELG